MNLSDNKLLKKIKELVRAQRRIHVLLIEHLQEVQRRRLYADLGYSSLYKYLVKELKLSEGAAIKRIDSLKLSQKVPKTKEHIQKGELSLTVASDTYRFCQRLCPQKTEQVIKKVINKSRSEATQEFLTLVQSSNPVVPQKLIVKPISSTLTRVHMNIKSETLNKIEQFRAYRKLSTEQALDHLADLGMSSLKHELNNIRRSKRINQQTIPAATKKKIRQRANNRCEFPGCDEIHYLEFEHLKPQSLGGTHDLENLKLFCRVHNQRSAIKVFGQSKMDPYLNRTAYSP